jgi:Leucine-rich repeat (LRR) protein
LFLEYEAQYLFPMTRCIRVLILSHCGDITKLPDSIGKLIHVCYLDLSCTNVNCLPNSICKLCNLQTLNLSNCGYLAALPRDMHKLINLHHLDFAETKIMEMPINLGKLKCLL